MCYIAPVIVKNINTIKKLSSGINMYKIQTSVLIMIFTCIYSINVNAFSLTEKTLVINNVVSETEEPYIETSIGRFGLPDYSTVVSMDGKSLAELSSLLEYNMGKEVKLYFCDNVVVGIKAPDKKKYLPKFSKKRKEKYSGERLKISTTMRFWENYVGDGLSIATANGLFCIGNDYKYSDYLDKVYKKLISKIPMNKKN
jgi:hypothetical protein